jgi:hypothetical protein
MKLYNYEEDEIIRPRKKAQPKAKKPKADHKHEYAILKVSEIHNVFNKYACIRCGKEKS